MGPDIASYSAFTYKVELNYNFTAPSRIRYNIGNLIVCFCGTVLDSCQVNLVTLGGESCSSSREPVSDSCIQFK
jgi:hypothetical protein